MKETTVRYKILMAVMAELPQFKNSLAKIPDKSKMVIVNNFDHDGVSEECRRLETEGAEVHWHPENMGCAAAMNVGINMLDHLDYVIVMSPSALFANSVQDFVDVIEGTEKIESNHIYWNPATENQQVAGVKTDMHCFAWTKRCFDEVGNYDENFYPVYFDDTDLCRRIDLIGVTKTYAVGFKRYSQTLNGACKSNPRIMRHFQENASRIHDYYFAKWGGEPAFEVFETPFNDPNLTVKDWSFNYDYGKFMLLPDSE